MLNKKVIASFQILLGGSMFGLIPIFVRYGTEATATQLVFFRAFFGMISIFIIGNLSGNKIKKFTTDKIKIICWAIILLFAITSYFISLKHIDIASAVLLLQLNSPFIIIFSRFWLKEKIHKHTLISLILSLFGAFLIISPSGFNYTENSIGYLFAISAAFWTGLNFVFPKKYLKEHDPYSLTFYQTLWQLPFILPFIFCTPIDISAKTISIYISLGFFCSALAFLFIYKGSKNTDTQYIGILQTAESIVPIILGVVLFFEIPSIKVVIGGMLLILGYVLILFKNTTKNHALILQEIQQTDN